VLCPVLRRPHRAQPLAESLAAATPDARLVFIATEGDDAEIDAVRATGCDLLILPGPHQHGDWSKKINYGYRNTTEPLMLLCGDDVVFHDGWLEAAASLMVGPIGVVGTNDLANERVMRGIHSTHPMVARRYADEQGTVEGPGRVVSECYQHNYVDDELVGTAKKRKAWAFARDSIVEHRHVFHGSAPDDEVYKLGRQGMRADRAVYRSREHLWRL